MINILIEKQKKAPRRTLLKNIILEMIYVSSYSSTTVQPEGMPLAPVLHSVPDALVNVPLAATFVSHSVQPVAEITVARHVTLLRLLQL